MFSAADEEDQEPGLDIGIAPIALWAEDPVSQSDVYRAMIEVHELDDEDDDKAKFNNTSAKKIKLSKLREIYNSGDRDAQLSLLKGRHRVVMDNGSMLNGDHPDACFNAKDGALDFGLFVPRDPGLKALLPNANTDLTISWKLSLRSRH